MRDDAFTSASSAAAAVPIDSHHRPLRPHLLQRQNTLWGVQGLVPSTNALITSIVVMTMDSIRTSTMCLMPDVEWDAVVAAAALPWPDASVMRDDTLHFLHHLFGYR